MGEETPLFFGGNMASVISKDLVNENLTADITSGTESLETGHVEVVGYLAVSNYASGTINATVEHSPDKVNWFPLASIGPLSANGGLLSQISDSNVHVLPNVRANVTMGGGDADVRVALYYDRRK
jgi:hypothetical protein